MINTLTLSAAIREGSSDPKASKKLRHFLDFVVDGKSLWERTGKPIDTVSVLCKEFGRDWITAAAERLVLKAEADAPENRRTLFVCSECADLGCGAITIEIARKGHLYVWHSFGYENTYEDDLHLANYQTIGPFEFEAIDYEKTIFEGRELLGHSSNNMG
jgi:hypothetical protein